MSIVTGTTPPLQGLRALVTGASGGLGSAIVATLVRQGAAVALGGRDPERLSVSAQTLARLHGARTCVVPLDLQHHDRIPASIAAAAEQLDGLDLVVNAAGAVAGGRLEATSTEDWRTSLDGKLIGTLTVIRAALPYLRATQGTVLTVTGLYGHEPEPEQIISGAINAALANSHKALARDVAAAGVRILTLCIGAFRTARLETIVASAAREQGITTGQALLQHERTLPGGRHGRPEELAELVAFLAAPLCPYLNGTALIVDGGACHSL